jgi:glycosyltransferase involved in cell wall biosynthesis
MTFFLYPEHHTRIKRLFFPPMIRWSARHSDAVIAISSSTRSDSIRLLGIPESKINTIPLGVEKDFHPAADKRLLEIVRTKHKLPESFILYVGTVEPRKNLPLLLCAFAGLLRRGTPYYLVVVGKLGWMYEDVFKLIDELGIKEKVRLTGYFPQEDLSSVYQLADIFVYPTSYEGFGLPVLEAMACGTPVITSNVSSMPEFVGNAGILIPPGDVEALEQAMLDLIYDKDKRERFSRAGIERAAAYTWEHMAEDTIKVYQRILGV